MGRYPQPRVEGPFGRLEDRRQLAALAGTLQPHVGRLDVAVQEAARVRVAQRGKQVAEEAPRLRRAGAGAGGGRCRGRRA